MAVEPFSGGKGSGATAFAWFMLLIIGVLNVIDGIVALARSRFYVDEAVFVFGDLRTWGWIVLIYGIVALFGAASVWKGGDFGRWAGIAIAGINIVVQMLFIQAYPFWSLLIIALDVLVIYALATYGRHTTD